jgi:hypothetical protein
MLFFAPVAAKCTSLLPDALYDVICGGRRAIRKLNINGRCLWQIAETH